MKRIDMYKETPGQFHNRINDTLEHLEERKVKHISVKRYLLVGAAVLVFCPVLCVGAGKLFQWYQIAGERFGTEKELEEKLTLEGAVLSGNDSDLEKEIEIKALQSIKKNNGYYLLAGFIWPYDVEWNENIMIEKSSIISQEGRLSCVANFVAAPDEKGMVFLETEVNGNQIIKDDGTIKLVLENICGMDKGAVTDTLVEATWEIEFSLPTNSETVSYETTEKLSVNHHELDIEKVEMSSFGVKIYTSKEEAIHASCYSAMWLSAVEYEDGTRENQIETPLGKLGSEDKTGRFYFDIPLENIVDTDKVSKLIFTEGEGSVSVELGQNSLEQTDEDLTEIKEIQSMSELSGIKDTDSLRTIYEKSGYAIVSDDINVYLWDRDCDTAIIIMKLSDYGYDKENGGEIIAQQGSGGKTILMKPFGDSKTVYLWKFNYPQIIENDVELVWPVK